MVTGVTPTRKKPQSTQSNLENTERMILFSTRQSLCDLLLHSVPSVAPAGLGGPTGQRIVIGTEYRV